MPQKPGGGGGTNPPTGFEYKSDQRLVTNGNLTRMPTTEIEWGTFIREMNKWVKNETGSYDPVFNGFSVDPGQSNSQGPTVLWHRYGQMVTLIFYFDNGTSDSTGFEVTGMPDNLKPAYAQTCQIGNLQDAGIEITDPCVVVIQTSGQLSFYPDNQFGLWTNSGAKGFTDTRPATSVTYSLMNPPKL